ncbi:MAG: IS1634 family transposase [Gammaproteobacteria bacterium]|nr:IS1634 family transposase [Gammaproteobacteria bacterium]
MYIAVVPNRRSPPAILLRESYREAGKVKTRTLANLTKLPPEAITALRRVLKGDKLVSPEKAFEVVASFHHGHVQAVVQAMRRIGFANLISPRPSRERDLVMAMVAARLLQPDSKLATIRWWHITSLPQVLGVADANEEDLYQAMDWVLDHQQRIEAKLAARHLKEGGLALYDLTSSYFEGHTCPLAARGHNRDGKKGKLQVNYGLLTDQRGCPVSVSVFQGNIADPKTLLPQVSKIREAFHLDRMVMVGDRGMITQKQVDVLRDTNGMDWIAALRPEAIKKLLKDESIQMGLFDEQNLFELSHPDFPNERLVACRNPDLASRRAHKRKSLIAATVLNLEQIRRMVEGGRLRGKQKIGERVRTILGKYRIGKYYQVELGDEGFEIKIDEKGILAEGVLRGKNDPHLTHKWQATFKRHVKAISRKLEYVLQRTQRGRLYGKDKIGIRVGKILNKHKVGKHFKLNIQDNAFDFAIDTDKVTAEAALDGIYVIRTSLSSDRITAQDTVRSYKQLSRVERAFRSFKTIDLKVRPIRHRTEDRVRAHIFLCMLAYYVQWHMIEAWKPLLFSDEDHQVKATRDPVVPAVRSEPALKKVCSKVLDDGTEVHSYQTLLTLMSSIVRNVCRISGAGPHAPTFDILTTPNQKQRHALDLLKTIQM